MFRDMVFLLGFFVKQIVARWWTAWEAVPVPGAVVVMMVMMVVMVMTLMVVVVVMMMILL